MTVAIEDIKAGPYEGDGVKTEFDFDFKTLTDTDVAVYHLDANDDETLLVKDTDYTITLNADQNGNPGGAITKLGAALPAGEFLTLVNEPDFTQSVKIRTESFVKPSVMETMIDRVTILAQRAKLDTARSLKMPVSWDDTPVDLPFPKADNILMWNDALDGFKNVAATAVTILDRLRDADNDTRIWVEKTPDDDTIRFDVAGAERGDWTAARLRVQDILEIHSADNTLSALHFGDPEDADVGRITYDHSGNVMRVWLSAGIKGRWDATGLNIAGNDVTGDGPLHIGAGLAGSVTAHANGDEAILESDQTNFGWSFLGGTSSVQHIFFGDTDDTRRGSINYDHANDRLQLNGVLGNEIQIRNGEIFLNGADLNVQVRIRGQGTNIFRALAATGNAVMGSTSADASALLDMVSTTKGLGLPVWTETERDAITSPRDGLAGYNSTNDSLDIRANSTWQSVLTNLDFDWTNSGAIDLSSGSPTSVTLASGLSGVEEIEIHIESVSTDTANQSPVIRLGDSGGLESSGYTGRGVTLNASVNRSTANSSDFHCGSNDDHDAVTQADFSIKLRHMGSNIWSFNCHGNNDNIMVSVGTGLKTLSAALTQVVLTTDGGSAVFDLGKAHVRYR